MRITLNLASRPFVELRPVYQRLRVFMLALVLLAGLLGALLHFESRKAEAARAHVDTLHHNIESLEQRQRNYQALMRQPANAAVLNQSEYLNGLFRRKAFSWTAIMMDLENVLPAGVQVLNIDPAVAPAGDVTIRLRVSGARERSIDLVRNLERSRHFLQPRITSEALQTNTSSEGTQQISANSNVNFDVLAEYRPLSVAPEGRPTGSKPPGKSDKAKGSGHKKAKRSAAHPGGAR
jgi:type IV pilus assembly protein PilN